MRLLAAFPGRTTRKGSPGATSAPRESPFRRTTGTYAAPTTCFTSAKWHADSCAAGVSLPS